MLARPTDALPVAVEQPVARLAGMAFARPVQQALLDESIVPAHGCCRNNTIVVGYPSHDQRIQFLNHPCLRSHLQLQQPLIDGRQVSSVRFLSGGNNQGEGLPPPWKSRLLPWLLPNIESQKIEADLTLIGVQGMRDTCFVGVKL